MIWEAEAVVGEFKKKHADAVIEQRYKVEDKTIIELIRVDTRNGQYRTLTKERSDHVPVESDANLK